MNLIKYFAAHYYRTIYHSHLAQILNFDDLTQIGTIAAFGAAKRFDETRGASLASFLSNRLIGEMHDACHPYRRRSYKDVVVISIDSYGQGLITGEGESDFIPDFMMDYDSPDTYDLIELQSCIAAFTNRLGGREREIFESILNEPRALHLVADDFDLTESRISQVRKKLKTRFHEEISS